MDSFACEVFPRGGDALQLSAGLVVIDFACRLRNALSHPEATRFARQEVRIDRCAMTTDTDSRQQKIRFAVAVRRFADPWEIYARQLTERRELISQCDVYVSIKHAH